ncbi:2OG-Fe(II) oxygenase [Geodermatophilus sp. SYSU D00703]
MTTASPSGRTGQDRADLPLCTRVDHLDWPALTARLHETGSALSGPLLTPQECREVSGLYDDDARFRSTVDMARLRFGAGQYRYFALPLPAAGADLRSAFYRRLLPVAREWAGRTGPPRGQHRPHRPSAHPRPRPARRRLTGSPPAVQCAARAAWTPRRWVERGAPVRGRGRWPVAVSVWAHRSPPAPAPGRAASWQERPSCVAELAGLRRRLRTALADGSLPAGADDGERLLLVIEELVSNGLRHGRPPVQVTVSAARLGWLVAVSDAAPGRAPIPAVDRDPGHGGMGLSLVARICGARGWAVEAGRKVVWARVPYLEPLQVERLDEALDRALVLAGQLTTSARHMATTLDALASARDTVGQTRTATRLRSRATRARLEAERARWVVLTARRGDRSAAGQAPSRSC